MHTARVDGASEWRIWWQMVLPLLRPALAAMAIFVALGEWNSFLWPLIIIRTEELFNLPIALSSLSNQIVSNPGCDGRGDGRLDAGYAADGGVLLHVPEALHQGHRPLGHQGVSKAAMPLMKQKCSIMGEAHKGIALSGIKA